MRLCHQREMLLVEYTYLLFNENINYRHNVVDYNYEKMREKGWP